MHLDIFSAAMIKTYLYAGITLFLAVLTDNVFRSLIKVPKNFDTRRARNFATSIKNFITITIYIVAFYIILTLFGINLTPLLASASVIGLVIGIGARSTIEDFVSGLFLLSMDSLAIGDYIKIGETEGYVEYLGARTLALRDEQNAIHVIPNSQVKELINFSRKKINVIIDIPVKTNQSLDKVLKAAEEALHHLQKDTEYAEALFPGSQVNGIESFAHPEMMTLRVTLITYPVRQWDIARRYRFLVKQAFEKHKLTFA